jgi:putative flippase GtrA
VAASRSARLVELWRYGQAGAVNAVFGFGAYSLFVWAGLNIYAAQVAATVLGVAFNYLTYSRHVFRDAGPAKMRFAASYVGNYLVSLLMLAIADRLVRSPYLAGLIAIVATAVVNYFALKYLVFRRAPSPGAGA